MYFTEIYSILGRDGLRNLNTENIYYKLNFAYHGHNFSRIFDYVKGRQTIYKTIKNNYDINYVVSWNMKSFSTNITNLRWTQSIK